MHLLFTCLILRLFKLHPRSTHVWHKPIICYRFAIFPRIIHTAQCVHSQKNAYLAKSKKQFIKINKIKNKNVYFETLTNVYIDNNLYDNNYFSDYVAAINLLIMIIIFTSNRNLLRL